MIIFNFSIQKVKRFCEKYSWKTLFFLLLHKKLAWLIFTTFFTNNDCEKNIHIKKLLATYYWDYQYLVLKHYKQPFSSVIFSHFYVAKTCCLKMFLFIFLFLFSWFQLDTPFLPLKRLYNTNFKFEEFGPRYIMQKWPYTMKMGQYYRIECNKITPSLTEIGC